MRTSPVAFAVACLLALACTARSRAQTPSILVAVDARQPLGANDRFWANAVFHPTEFLDHEWGRQHLALLHDSGVARNFVRIYNQPEDAAYYREDGSVGYRWDHFDRRADLIVAQGCRLHVAFFSMPPPIAAEPATNRARTFLDGKKIYIGPPKDYLEWQAMCADFTRHVIARYGEERVAQWRFTCWNEPNLTDFWSKGDLGAYERLYDHFAQGVRSVFPRVPIGGPALSSTRTFARPEHFREYLRHVARGTNHATGGRGSPIDYIAVHTYGGSNGAGSTFRPFPSVDYIIEQQRRLVAIRDEFPELRHVPLVAQEWGITSGGTTGVAKQPMAVVRNSHYGAAFLVGLVARQLEWRQREDPRVGDLFICLSGYETDRKTDFEGMRTVQTLHGFDKPILNAFRLLAKLGPQWVACRVEPAGKNLWAVATRNGDNHVAVLITHLRDDLPNSTGPDVSVSLKLEHFWPKGTPLELRHWRIDESHGNAYGVFSRLGRPKNPTVEQIAQIKHRMGLELFEPPRQIRVEQTINLAVTLPWNAVSLLELERRH